MVMTRSPNAKSGVWGVADGPGGIEMGGGAGNRDSLRPGRCLVFTWSIPGVQNIRVSPSVFCCNLLLVLCSNVIAVNYNERELIMQLNEEQKARILCMWDKGAGVDDIAGDIDIEEETIAEFLRSQGFTV